MRQKKSAFTIVELLVVIGVISILAGMMMPALAHVKSKARKTDCMNNMRNVGQSLLQYQTSNKGFLPAYYRSTTGDNLKYDGYKDSWVQLLKEAAGKGQLEFSHKSFACAERPEVGTAFATIGSEESYDGANTPFGYNPMVGGAGTSSIAAGRGARFSVIEDPGTWLLWDHTHQFGPATAWAQPISWKLKKYKDNNIDLTSQIKASYYDLETVGTSHGRSYLYFSMGGSIAQKTSDEMMTDLMDAADKKIATGSISDNIYDPKGVNASATDPMPIDPGPIGPKPVGTVPTNADVAPKVTPKVAPKTVAPMNTKVDATNIGG